MTKKEKSFSQDEEMVEQGEVEQAEVEQPEEIESVKKALAEEKSEKYLANWQRAQADLINYKRRSEQERAEVVNYANSTLILDMLPVLDDLERALGNVPDELAESPWIDGIRHIYRKLQAVLDAQGVSVIEAEGKDFDPNFHEAVMSVEGEEGKVIEETQKGYKLRNRVIRPTKVKVGRGAPNI
ncbi:MAG: nucleotide exchange factor GrpE [Chloroflexi bacterium]|nr:nucleotide exchange factor GrpE [Chloroflexota bacterium]